MKKKITLFLFTLLFVSATAIAQNSISLENNGYNAIYVELYVKEHGAWVYLDTYRIPGGSSISFDIGHENYWQYGYSKRSSYSNYITSFYNSHIILY
jgi:hypothetical protein